MFEGKMKSLLASILLLGLLSCGSDSADENLDPRCQSICIIDEPSLDGAFDICSEASAGLCKDECTVRIEEATSLCATCLLEDADFGVGIRAGSSDFCDNGICQKIGREGTCTYTQGDDQARDDCSRQVFPRREVHCDTEYAPVLDCSAICQ
ncbi:MAG: hypothetical protein JKY56_04105 [Kofleriaceae bacterium]|nr:hypothetical protein [Kofleriaceae bacterium]